MWNCWLVFLKRKMGNFASRRNRMIRSNTILAEATDRAQRKSDEIRKSKSLSELNRRTSVRSSQNRSSTATKTAAGSSSTSVSRSLSNSNKSFRKEPPHPVTGLGREIVIGCLDNPHADLGNRICMRVFERRNDYQKFIYALGREKWPYVTSTLREFVEQVVINLDDLDTIERLSRKYGEEHVEMKAFGFKPDFWVSLADAMIVECVILDMASHSPTETVAAWSQLVTVMFSSIRDGYYAALRIHRQSSRRMLQRQSTADSSATSHNSSQERGTESPPLQRSGSPMLISVPSALSSSETPSPLARPTSLTPISLMSRSSASSPSYTPTKLPVST